jgi:Domain of unknown function (DUF5606)
VPGNSWNGVCRIQIILHALKNELMEYAKIIAITGMPGLYEMVTSKGDGAIVRSLDDQSTKFVSGRVHHFTHLESIEVYTQRENVNLVEVFNAMKTSQEKLPDEKDNNSIQSYFTRVYPALDFERVYSSDMKKMIKWFDVLLRNKVDLKLAEPEEELVEVEAEEKPKARIEKQDEEKTEKKTKQAKKEEPKPAGKKVEAKAQNVKAAKEKEEPKKTAKKAAKKEEPKKSAAKKKK